MKTLTISALTTLLAAPALAHGGAHTHMHPHGSESLIAAIGLAALVIAGGALAYRKSRK